MAITSIKSTRDIARIWFYWKVPALIIFCVIVFCICFYAFTATPMYESRAKLMVLPKPNEESVVSPGEDSRQYLAREVTSSDINTEIELLRSDVVIQKTVEFYKEQGQVNEETSEPEPSKWNIFARLGLTKKPLTNLEKKAKTLSSAMDVFHVLNSNIISVSMLSPHQDQVSDVLKQVLATYISYRKNTFKLGDTIEFYEDQKEYYAKKLAEAIKRMKEFKSQYNIVNMESQTAANLNLIAAFQTDLKNLEVAIAENNAKIAMLESGLEIKGEEITLSKEMRSMPVIVELARGLVPLLIKRTEVSKTFTRQSREYQQIDDQIRMLRQEIRNEIGNAAKTDHLENRTLEIKRDVLAQKIESLKKASKEFQDKKEAYSALELDVEIARRNFLKYGDKKEDSRLFSERDDSNLSNVVITEAPTVPRRPKSPNRLLAIQVAILLGLFAALILPFVLETLDQKLKTSDDVERIIQLPVVCTYSEI